MHENQAAATLSSLMEEVWEARMRDDPIFATMCGDHRYNDRLPEVSEAAAQDWLVQLRGYRERLDTIDQTGLAQDAHLTYQCLARELDDEIADLSFGLRRMPLAKAFGFHQTFSDLPLYTPFQNTEDYERYLVRLRGLPAYIDGYLDLTRCGLQTGHVQPRAAMEGVDRSVRGLITDDPAENLLFEPFTHFPQAIGEAERARLREAGAAAIREAVNPAYRKLADFLTDTYLPAARASVGASALPDGDAFYAHCVRKYTTLDLTPQQVHETGLAEVARIRAEMDSVIRRVGFKGDFRAFVTFLRTDARFYAATPEALLQISALVLKRMDGELPTLFSQLPRTPYGIREVPAYQAPYTTTAYYFPAPGDSTKAGFYYVNTYDLKSRPLYEVEALSLHEAVPGHHLQLALQQELDLPAFRRFGGVTAFVEGWALYAERLGLETGFYTDPYSDFGRLTYEIWRACRLVVDTGLHAMGWTRQQAIDYMAENSALSLLNIANEVDRYIAWPGQALAYKIGELKIRELRAFAEQILGPRFDRRMFHKVVLEHGSIPLQALEARVRAWVAEEARQD